MIHKTVCPLIKAIDYGPDGRIIRVEFKADSDRLPVQVTQHRGLRLDLKKPIGRKSDIRASV
ncbi:MAG: hypothetical protein KGL39_53470 [Patescibacteria group bacterium]|nr:hypothetical protein [Patescibacteria group bacterium]